MRANWRMGLTVVLGLAAGACNRACWVGQGDDDSGAEWRFEASQALAALAAGDCRRADDLLSDVRLADRDKNWHQLRMLTCMACGTQGSAVRGVQAWAPAAARDASAAFPGSPRMALSAGMCWEAVGSRGRAKGEYKRAELLARQVLASATQEPGMAEEAREVLGVVESRGRAVD
jgi:hypothetical protein